MVAPVTPEASTPTQETSLVPPPRGSDLPSWRACARVPRAPHHRALPRLGARALALATSIYLAGWRASTPCPRWACAHSEPVIRGAPRDLPRRQGRRACRALRYGASLLLILRTPVPFELLFQHTCASRNRRNHTAVL